MTRPMPEPPECTCMSRGNFCWTCVDTIGYDPEEECPSCPVHAVPTKRLTTYRKCSEPKRLTDAECAAERGEARADWMHMKFLIASRQVVSMRARPNAPMPEPSPPLERKLDEARGRFYTWRRFARTPHLDADAT